MGVPEHNQSIIDGDANLTLDGGAVDIEDRAGRVVGKVRLMDSGEALVDPATEGTLSSELSREIATWSAGVLPIQEDAPLDVSAETVGVEQADPAQPFVTGLVDATEGSPQPITPAQNSDGSSVSASTAATGSGEAAAVSIPDGRTTVTAAWDVSGAAVVTVEVSHGVGDTWYEEHSAEPGGAETGTHTFTTGFDDVRIHVDANLNSASIGAKGV